MLCFYRTKERAFVLDWFSSLYRTSLSDEVSCIVHSIYINRTTTDVAKLYGQIHYFFANEDEVACDIGCIMTTMDDHCQVRPPRNIGCENHACATCSCNHANDSAISELSNCNRRCGCARSRPSIAKCRQTSVTSGDSGLGLSLNPITEQEDCSATDIGDSCARWSKNPTRERHNSRDPECYCSHDENVSSEESGLMFKSTCCCENTESNTNARTLARTVSSEPHAIGRTRICKSGRARTRSESCATENYIATSNTRMDFPPQNHNMAEIYAPQQCMKKNVHDLNASYRDVRRSPYRRMYVFMIFVTMISLGSIAFAYVGYSNNKLQFNGTESKVNMT